MLRSLSEEWSPLKMLIENTKDINTYSLEELYGTLMTYELNRTETKKKMLNSKEEERGQVAFKSIVDECTSSKNMKDEELDDLVLLVKKWKGFRQKYRFQKKEENGEKKNRFIKKKALQATWDESDDDEDESQEEIVNMCSMVIEDDVNTNEHSNELINRMDKDNQGTSICITKISMYD